MRVSVLAEAATFELLSPSTRHSSLSPARKSEHWPSIWPTRRATDSASACSATASTSLDIGVPNHILRDVPKYSAEPPLVTVFRALADPTRLSVIERLSISPASATELARPFDMALPSFMQHLQILEDAKLVMSHKSGRTRTYQLQPDTLKIASTWFATFRNHWDRRMDQLEALLQPPTLSTTTNSTKKFEQESQ